MAKLSARGAQKLFAVEFQSGERRMKLTVTSDGRVLRQIRQPWDNNRLGGFTVYSKYKNVANATEEHLVAKMKLRGWERV